MYHIAYQLPTQRHTKLMKIKVQPAAHSGRKGVGWELLLHYGKLRAKN